MAACSIEDYKVVAKSDDKLSQIKEVSGEELKNWIERKSTTSGSPFFLIDTLPKESFNVCFFSSTFNLKKYQHLPSAVNADLHSMQKEFLDNVNEIVSGNKEANIIVYCSG
jgi:hypothetical protein